MRADSFHRLMKTLLDSGEAATVEQAMQMFSGYGVRIVVNPSLESSLSEQIIALTAINTAARSFQGNVYVDCGDDVVLTAQGFEGQRLSQFCSWAGVAQNVTPMPSWPVIYIGGLGEEHSANGLHPWANGWVFGLGKGAVAGASVFAPACVAAGAMAVSEAFSMLRGDNPYAGRRAIQFSLWSMSAEDSAQPSINIEAIKDGIWIVGLGHLGQAYCWTLGFMPVAYPLQMVLQDIDVVTTSTLSTSVLSCKPDVGQRKTRIVANWLEGRGFETHIVERRFDAATRVAVGEPLTALFGVDNAAARRCCEQAGFSLVLDAGLGSGYKDFRALRMRAFPGASSASRLWSEEPEKAISSVALAYQALLDGGHDQCGVTTLATRAVGAPFVGCYAAAILIAELLKRRLNGRGNDVININLKQPLSVEKA